MKLYSLGFWLVSGSAFVLLFFVNPTAARIKADETLLNNSIVIQHGNVTTIEAGTTAGAKLFYSIGSF